MFSSLSTKLAMRKMGISNDTFNFSVSDVMGTSPPPKDNLTGGGKLRKARPPQTSSAADDDDTTKAWPTWMSAKALPLSVQPWLTPAPAAVPVAAACPQKGDPAPLDRDRKLPIPVGGGKPVLVVFLRCVGCAFAQRTFLNLRTLANRHAGEITCVAVSHASAAATKKWIDLLGGAWNVQVVVDEDRSVYAAWGLGLGSVWYVLNPGTQIQSWKETGWLGQSVASYMEKSRPAGTTTTTTTTTDDSAGTTIMGNKWQQAGAFAVNGQGIVMWGVKAARADDVLDLDRGLASLGIV